MAGRYLRERTRERRGSARALGMFLLILATACGTSTGTDAGGASSGGFSSGGGSSSGARSSSGGSSSSGGGSSSSSGGSSSSGASSSSGGSSSSGVSSSSGGSSSSGASSSSGGSSSSGASSSSGGSGTVPADAIYVSPAGTSAAAGTASAPLDLVTAIGKVAAGGTIAVKGGTYTFSKQITITAAMSGQDGKLKHLVAVPGERVILDFSGEALGSSSRGIRLSGSWWHVKGLEITGAGDNGMYLDGSHDIVEGCTFRSNRDSGLQISAESGTPQASWPSHNLILNCEAYDNSDATGENADGFACKLMAGPGNVFRGCVSHHNSDDGWDLYTKQATGPISPVVIDRCVAFKNGTLLNGTQNANGDRNGFKLGGDTLAVAHVVTRSVAFANGKNGFTWNSNPGVIWLVNNTAWDNAQGNFKFDDPDSLARFANNVSFWTTGAGISDRAAAGSGTVVQDNAFWDKTKGTLWGFTGKPAATLGASAFESLAAPTTFPLPRLADGSFELGALARLASSSPLVDAGVVPSVPPGAGVTALPFDAATSYKGAADGGAFELK